MSAMEQITADVSAELVLSVVADMRKALEVSPDSRELAREKAAAHSLDEGVLWSEWLNLVLHSDTYHEVVGSQDQAYLEWLADRVTKPFGVSPQIVERICNRYGADVGMKLAYVTWLQEIAWAHRMRRAEDARVAVLSHLFVLNARKDPSREYARLAEYYDAASTVYEYLRAPEHNLTPEQIRGGYGSNTFEPLYMRYAEASMAEKVKRLSMPELEAMALNVRRLEEKEMQKHTQARALRALQEAGMTRMSGVIAVAIEVGLDSDGLCHAQRLFVEAIRSGELTLPTDTGLPYAEFISWIRAELPDQPEADWAASDRRRKQLLDVVSRPKSWTRKLPPEYRSMGASDGMTYNSWITPIVEKSRPIPEDMVLDYGFFLVGKNFQNL